MSERRAASTIGELDIHLGNVQDSIRELRDTVGNMATKEDIKALTARMENFATKDELRRVEMRLEADSAPSLFWRWVGNAQKIAAAITVVAAACGLIFGGFWVADKLPK